MSRLAALAAAALMVAVGCQVRHRDDPPPPDSPPAALVARLNEVARLNPSFTCWAEPNREMPEGWEVICRP